MRKSASFGWLVWLSAVSVLAVGDLARGETRLELKPGDVVAFAGGTNMVRLQRSGWLETQLAHAFGDAKPRFRDLSWEADTVFRQGTVIERWRPDGFGDRDEQLRRVGATVVVAQFGRLESLSGVAELPRFVAAYERLLDSYQGVRQAKNGQERKVTRRVVLVSPTPFEKPSSPLIPDLSKHNGALKRYVEATAELAARRGAVFVDLFSDAEPRLTDNGMHIAPAAQTRVARRIVKQLGLSPVAADQLAALHAAVVEKHRLWYDYWRPANWKLLYGDDSRRQFTRGGNDYIPFRDEWQKLVPMIAAAERRIWQLAAGGPDPGPQRPRPERLHGDPTANVETELAAFSTTNGLKVNLFASEQHGLTSPLAIRWDPSGRMYVTVTTTYPHVFPGDVANDKIILLEDTDRDGQADKSTVFADGLNIPTGLEWGDGGVYVGQNTEILFLRDTNNDGRADERRVVLGGFGNGDSHQTINSFIWSPGGELFFGQGDGCESRVETPWGASDLFQAGFYRFRPRRLQLHPLLDDFMGPGNPWGVAFDDWGQIFSVDGAGGVTYLSPGQVPVHHRLRLRTIGKPGGYCGIGYLDGEHLPQELRGDFVVGDFKSNRLKRFSVKPDGAGYSLQWKEPLLRSRHRNFRPVDVKQGPDGAIYVVDWYNPITCHQDDAYRDPRRDKAHGRIWRLSAAAQPIPYTDLSAAPLEEVVKGLAATDHVTRYRTKRELTARDAQAVARELAEWVRSLDPKSPRYEHHLFEALGAYATIEVVETTVLDRLLQSSEPRARAYATRLIGRWHDRLDRPLQRLARRVGDEHPQVRMEAVMACAAIPSPQAIGVAARVVDRPVDSWIDYAFTQTVHHLKPHWLPALQRGEVRFDQPAHLAAVLNKAGGQAVLAGLKKLVDSPDLERPVRAAAIATILTVGSPTDIRDYGLARTRFVTGTTYDAAAHREALARLVEVAPYRKQRPAGDPSKPLQALIEANDLKTRSAALRLAGIWQVKELGGRVVEIAGDRKQSLPVRAAALAAIADLDIKRARELLANAASPAESTELRAAAIASLSGIELPAAAEAATRLLNEPEISKSTSSAVLTAFLDRLQGPSTLAAALRAGKLAKPVARRLIPVLLATGRSDPELLAVLSEAVGGTARAPMFRPARVRQLVAAAAREGDAERGSRLFQAAACAACHRVAGRGGAVGPDLTAIGTTLAPDRIVEELLWPNRQVKEGFSVAQVIKTDGKVVQGYVRNSQQSRRTGDLVLEDPANGKRVTIAADDIDEKRVLGSPMPEGLVALLSDQQLYDLIRYLTHLGRLDSDDRIQPRSVR